MKLSMQQLEEFVAEWVAAGDETVQSWKAWEVRAAQVLLTTGDVASENCMHGVMDIALTVLGGTVADVKRELRRASPSSLAAAVAAFDDLPEFRAVLDAETRFRACELDGDWSLVLDGSGTCVVRSRFRKRETRH